jgi:hypothetical protein
MIKIRELNDPASCLSKAKDNELLFVLLARDQAAPAVIRYWTEERIRLGKNEASDPQITEALECAAAMERQRAGIRSLEEDKSRGGNDE